MDRCQDKECPNFDKEEANSCITFKQVSECPTPDYLNSKTESGAQVPCSDVLSLRGKLLKAALDIELQATRHRRASPFKRYLLTDLEIIGDKARELWKLIDQER